MARHGIGPILDTPRTHLGDATFLHQPPPDLDMSQELSFQSPSKGRGSGPTSGTDILAHLRAGGGGGNVNVNFKTPRARAALANRRNPAGPVSGSMANEFTPLIKSASRNLGGVSGGGGGGRGLNGAGVGGKGRYGKESSITRDGASAVAALMAAVPPTPGLDRIDEDLTGLPALGDVSAYVENTVLPLVDDVDASSAMSTPTAVRSRRFGSKSDRDPLGDGKNLSLRETEHVIDRIEKENFALKLKIHFLEDALNKSGTEYNQAALKENADLKVDQVTLKRDLIRYQRQVASAERDVEKYRHQLVQWQDRAQRKKADGSGGNGGADAAELAAAKTELEKLRRALQAR